MPKIRPNSERKERTIMWKELVLDSSRIIEEVMRLIGEMLDDEYEFKVEDHKIWYR